MVKFQIMSDLHIEMENCVPSPLKYITPSADILILAGDIGRISKLYQLKKFLKELCSYFKIVLYVMGNHEYYMVDGYPEKNMETLFTELLEAKKEMPNLYILDRDSVIIENVCIVGCTLWSKPDVIVPKFIVKVKEMTTEKYRSLFDQDLEYIEHMIEYCKKHSLKLLVVTHHSPTPIVAKNKERTKYKSLYSTPLDRLLHSDKVHTWVYGHLHKNYDFFTDGGTRLLSNQKGKEYDNVQDYRKNKIFEV